MIKNYTQPKFELVKTSESNKIFFAASGTPSFGGSIASMGSSMGSW